MSRDGFGEGKTVCVTGASGYIASWMVKLLLQRGYIVKASVRDPNDPRKTEHLRELPGAKERLHLFKANLLEEGAFDAIVDNCEGVFHVASPCILESDDPQAEIIEPAVNGTLNVLRSCAKSPSVKRVIYTSSISSALYSGKRLTPEAVVDETWFSDPEFCKKYKLWYPLSKTLAEDAAWKFSKDHGIDLIVTNAAVAVGPLLQPTLNGSAEFILDLINGSQTYKNLTIGWVDVRDVANAHILAFETPSASGRYFILERVAHFSEVVKILREIYPDIQLPEKCENEKRFQPVYQVSRQKTESLGLHLTPLAVSLKETVESLKDKKFVNL
ncbi:Coumarine and phenylpropanoid biosynthesis [Ranunculus cassubicifolius]